MSQRTLCAGVTLIELMISLTLSLVLLGLVVGIYLSTEKQNRLLMAMMALQDNANVVLRRLEQEIQLAGWIGCPRLSSDFPLGNTSAFTLNAANKLELHQDSSGSTEITVRHRSAQSAALLVPMRQASTLELSSELEVAPGDVLLIADCQHADLFRVATVSRYAGWQKLTTTAPLRFVYEANAEVGEFEQNTYSVGPNGAWSVTDRRGRKIELVEGVKKLHAEWSAGGRGVAIELQVFQQQWSQTQFGFMGLRSNPPSSAL